MADTPAISSYRRSRRLTNISSHGIHPAWSPDGTRSPS
jgi:hypothetical protein